MEELRHNIEPLKKLAKPSNIKPTTETTWKTVLCLPKDRVQIGRLKENPQRSRLLSIKYRAITLITESKYSLLNLQMALTWRNTYVLENRVIILSNLD